MTFAVETIFDDETFSASHLLWDKDSRHAAVIDPVLDFDMVSGRRSHETADRLLSLITENDLSVDWILETHVHADHLTSAPYLKEILGAKSGIGRRVTEVQQTFSRLFNADDGFQTDGSDFDRLFDDGDIISLGATEIRVAATPGHTPACVTYVLDGAAFVGDTLFMPDYGTARCDFPGGDARTLYRSIQKTLALPPDTILYMCHDYAPGGREYRWAASVADQRRDNIHIGGDVGEDEFVAMREARDKTLSLPRLILPSVQVNMRAGHLPPAESDGVHYLKLPIDRF